MLAMIGQDLAREIARRVVFSVKEMRADGDRGL